MYRRIKQTGMFALGVGSLADFYRRKHHSHTVYAEVRENEGVRHSGSPREVTTMPTQEVLPQLQLIQVQVMFRHGARTPLHLIPKIPEANYDPEFLLKENQASVFPYERLLYGSGVPVDWSDYEKKLMHTPLKSGVPCGALTAPGKQQVYMLGRKLQSIYRDKLNLATYNPKDVLVLSSNIKRTVESARGVLAGFFGKEHMQAYAEQVSPVKIYIADKKYNILVPDTSNCAVLKKVNHAGMMHSDFIPGFKADRLAIEKTINDAREKKIEAVKEVQEKINSLRGSPVKDDSRHSLQNSNHLENLVLQQLIEERNQAIAQVERLWGYAMKRNPNLANRITGDDMRALVYLRRLEVEQSETKLSSGYRFHFYFDPNPYFSNKHLCKEVYINHQSETRSSWSTPVTWKEYGKLLQDETHKENKAAGQCHADDKSQTKSAQSSQKELDVHESKNTCTCSNTQTSFFQWYLKPVCAQHDHIGRAIKDEIWINPVEFFETETTYKDKWDWSFNFVFARDDLIARGAHGLAYPAELKEFEEVIEDRATTMLHYAMTGQHLEERDVVVRLCAGPLVTAMVDECEKVMKGEGQGYKLCLYSSHDSTMSGLLELLGIWDNKWPPFAADVRLELYKEVNSSDFYVKVLYCGKVCQIRGQTSELVPWSEFVKSVRKYLIREDQYKEICACDVLERFAADLLKHVEGEIVKPSEVPAGM